MKGITILRLQEFLGLVQGCFPNTSCIIAGGAVRDTLNGRPVKDIDVFLESGPADIPGCQKLADKLYDSDFEGFGQHKDEDYPENDNTFSVVNLNKGIGSTPCQLIFLNRDPVENVKQHFDFDISKCWVTRYKTWGAPDFQRAMVAKRITYCPGTKANAEQKASSRERLLRLKDKYPEWHFNAIIT